MVRETFESCGLSRDERCLRKLLIEGGGPLFEEHRAEYTAATVPTQHSAAVGLGRKSLSLHPPPSSGDAEKKCACRNQHVHARLFCSLGCEAATAEMTDGLSMKYSF